MESNADLKTTLQSLAEAHGELLRATESGDTARIIDLLDGISSLERRRNRLIKRDQEFAYAKSRPTRYETNLPARDQVIRALQVTTRPTTGKLISDVTKARWGESVDSAVLSSMRRDEARSWSAANDDSKRTSPRDVYIVPALSYDRFAPVRGTLALSNWPLALRLIAPLSPRVDMLICSIQIARATEELTNSSQLRDMLRLARRLGASIPGVSPFDANPGQIIECARAELAQLEDADSSERDEAAGRAARQLDKETSLFGAAFRLASKRRTAES